MIDYDQIRRFYDANRAQVDDDVDFVRGTIEQAVGVVRFRNRAEARHLARALPLLRTQDVLDLGGGSGRWALWFARRCRQVTMVDLAPSLVDSAARNAQRAGLNNVTCLAGSVLYPPLPPEQSFDVVHVGNVLTYVNDHDLPRARAVIEQRTRPGGRFVLREPVDPHGPSVDERPGGYRALFRRPEVYRDLFAEGWQLTYQRTTVSHLVPRGRDTRAALGALQTSGWRRLLRDRLLPWLAYVDYQLLGVEEAVRRTPARALLGDPGVIQHFYIFHRR